MGVKQVAIKDKSKSTESVIARRGAQFTGTLTQRNATTDFKFAQLVFTTSYGTRLCVTRDIALARSLRIGRKYTVVGTRCMIGHKSYIKDPVIKSVDSKKVIVVAKAHKKVMSGIVVALMTGLTAMILQVTGDNGNHYAATAAQPQSNQSASTSSTTPQVEPASKTTSSTTMNNGNYWYWKNKNNQSTTPESATPQTTSPAATTPTATTPVATTPTTPTEPDPTTPTTPTEPDPTTPTDPEI